MTVFSSFYFIVVSVSTTGYGDFAPTTTLGRLVVLLLLVVGIIMCVPTRRCPTAPLVVSCRPGVAHHTTLARTGSPTRQLRS